jgi:hypothetical protein
MLKWLKKKLSFGALPCKSLCHHPLHRFHWSCLYCRVRRFFYGKMDRTKYHYNRYLGCVLPTQPSKMATYVLIIDGNRRLARVKEMILKRVLTIAEWLAN